MVILPLQLDEISVTKQGKRLLGPISVKIESGGITILMGPNGAGKTTLLKTMHGMTRYKGSVRWAVPTNIAHAHQRFVFQRPVLLQRDVRDNIAYPLQIAGLSKKEAREKAAQQAATVGLSDHLKTAAHDLSGGEAQRLAVARALVTSPQVLFLDEPCAFLDGKSTREIENILLTARNNGTTIIMSTHDIGQARRLANNVVFLIDGIIHEISSAESFFPHPKTAEALAYINGEIVG